MAKLEHHPAPELGTQVAAQVMTGLHAEVVEQLAVFLAARDLKWNSIGCNFKWRRRISSGCFAGFGRKVRSSLSLLKRCRGITITFYASVCTSRALRFSFVALHMTYPDDMSTKMVRFPGLQSLYLQVTQPVRDLGTLVLALLLAGQSGKLLLGLGKDAIAAFVSYIE